jgi:hypothetical protein
MQYMIGSLALQYFREGGSWIDFREGMQYFGSTFEIVLSVAEKSLGLRDAREIFFLRHFLIFLSYYAGVVALFFLGKKSFGNNLWALLTCILFVFSPRIFGHAFFYRSSVDPLTPNATAVVRQHPPACICMRYCRDNTSHWYLSSATNGAIFGTSTPGFLQEQRMLGACDYFRSSLFCFISTHFHRTVAIFMASASAAFFAGVCVYELTSI